LQLFSEESSVTDVYDGAAVKFVIGRIAITVMLALVCSSSFAQRGGDEISPAFEKYRVTPFYRGTVRPPNFGDLRQYEGTDVRCFSGDPAEYSKASVNFAGHFVIGSCACGSGCHYLFMWDAANGHFYKIPIGSINVGPFDVGGSDPVYFKGEEYRADSSLLVADGCVDGTCNCGTRYYQWTGKVFRLVARRSSRMPLECRH
jgi:hypothetical protein